jgi:predicted DNA-binding transcriptional regulator AlpA
MSERNKVPENVWFRIGKLPNLSESASEFAREHPKEAEIAVTAALEATAAQYKSKSADAKEYLPNAIKPYVVSKPPKFELIGVSEAATRLRISRTTVYDWVNKHILLAWTTTKRGLIIPAEQILGPGRVVPGTSEVLEIIEAPELAWTFLSEEWPFADEAARPIDKLKVGEIEEVIDAAPGFGTVFT